MAGIEVQTGELVQEDRLDAKRPLDRLLTAEGGVILSQFLLHLQVNDMWLCKLDIGGPPKVLNLDEALNIKDEFKALLAGS